MARSKIILIRFINLSINVNIIFISFTVTNNFNTKTPQIKKKKIDGEIIDFKIP
jgi:hypothetical protein